MDPPTSPYVEKQRILQKLHQDCDLCVKGFDATADLGLHLRSNHESKVEDPNQNKDHPHVKNEVVKPLQVFVNDGAAQELKLSAPEEKVFKCHMCLKSFHWNSEYTRHMYTHTGEKNFQCDICQKKFSLKSTLTRHKKTHIVEKDHVCRICNKGFSRSWDFDQHMYKHTGEKKFECEVCLKTFSINSVLTSHMKIHTGEKNYPCNVCNKRFTYKRYLFDHLNTHLEKKYECHICDKKYSDKLYYRDHMNVHKGEKKYECELCHKLFMARKNLTKHQKSHEKDMSDVEHLNDEDLLMKTDLENENLNQESSLKGGDQIKDKEKKNSIQDNFLIRHGLDNKKKLEGFRKSYPCNICGKAFYKMRELICHRKLHQSERKYKCVMPERRLIKHQSFYPQSDPPRTKCYSV